MHKTFFSTIGMLLVGSQLLGQVIATEDKRGAFLDEVDSVLGNNDGLIESVENIESPFFKPLPEVIEQPESTAVAIPVVPEKMDDEILEIVANQLNATGSLILGDRAFLQLSNGGKLKKGQKFNARIKGVVYPIQILDVRTSGYTLQLNETRSVRKFNEKSSTQIRRNVKAEPVPVN